MEDRKTVMLGWMIWLMGSIFVFYKFIIEVSPSVLGSKMMVLFNITGTHWGWFSAAYYISYGLMQLPMGLLLDRYGPKLMMSICIFLCAIGSYWLGHSHTFLSAFFARLVTGIGAAAAVIGCMKLISMWFPPQRFAFMVGLMMSLGMLGAVFGELPLDTLIHHFGWQKAVRFIAFGGAALFVLFVLVVRERDNGAVHCADHPPVLTSLQAVISNPQSWWLSLFSGLAFSPVAVYGGAWGVAFMQSVNHLSHAEAAQAVSGVFYGFSIGAPSWGWLSDRFGQRIVFIRWAIVVAMLCSIAFVVVTVSSVLFQFLLFLTFGFCISAFVLSFSMVREANLVIYAASAVGFMNFFNSFFAFTIDPVIGKVLDHMSIVSKDHHALHHFSPYGFQISMSIVPLTLLLALILLSMVKETHCSQKAIRPEGVLHTDR